MELRKFHIDKFPQDRIFILLDKKFHKELFDCINSRYSFECLNKIFQGKLNKHTYKSWRYRIKKPGNKIPQFIPLWFLTEISKIFKNKYPLIKIERNIGAYKGSSTSTIIWKPNLPLPEDGRLLKILAHLIGDGHVSGAFGTGLPKGKTHSEYRNYNNGLLNQFVKDIQVFGKVHTSTSYDHHHVIFSNALGYILKHVYNIKFDSLNSRIPAIFYSLNKKLIANFIRAFCDDEGHVYDNHIDFYSTNKPLLTSIIRLIKLKFPELKVSELKISKRKKKNHHDKYYFYILSESREKYLELIGFDHEEKREDLIFNIKRSLLNKKTGKKGLTKHIILEIFNKESLSAKQLSRKLYLAHGTILGHLNQLKNKGLIKIDGKGKRNDNIWSLYKLNSHGSQPSHTILKTRMG